MQILGDGWRLMRREFPTAIGPVDLMCRDHDGGCVAIEIKRRGEIDGVEQLTRYLELLNRDPLLAPVQGIFAAQEIKPQARVLAEDRGIRCVCSTTTRCAAPTTARCGCSDRPRDIARSCGKPTATQASRPGFRAILPRDVAHLRTRDLQAGYYGPVMGTDQGPAPDLPVRKPPARARLGAVQVPRLRAAGARLGAADPQPGAAGPRCRNCTARKPGLPARDSELPPRNPGLPTRNPVLPGPQPGISRPATRISRPATRTCRPAIQGCRRAARGCQRGPRGSAGRHRSPHQLSVPSDAPALILAVPGPATDAGIDVTAGIIDVASQSCPGVTVPGRLPGGRRGEPQLGAGWLPQRGWPPGGRGGPDAHLPDAGDRRGDHCGGGRGGPAGAVPQRLWASIRSWPGRCTPGSPRLAWPAETGWAGSVSPAPRRRVCWSRRSAPTRCPSPALSDAEKPAIDVDLHTARVAFFW